MLACGALRVCVQLAGKATSNTPAHALLQADARLLPFGERVQKMFACWMRLQKGKRPMLRIRHLVPGCILHALTPALAHTNARARAYARLCTNTHANAHSSSDVRAGI